MDREVINKFLTEWMGICFWQGHSCGKCTNADGSPRKHFKRRIGAIDFFTEVGFFKLWKFMREKDLLERFLLNELGISERKYSRFIHLTDPEELAPRVYNYLNKK